MSKPIVVPLDGSPLAEYALVPAVGIAKALRAPIHLIRIRDAVPSPFAYPLLSAALTADVAQSREGMTAGETYLQAIAMRVENEIDASGVMVTELEGSPVKTIIDYARRANASTIVMATRRHDGTQRAVLSSVADAVSRRAGIPVLLTGPHTAPMRRNEEWACKRILIPIDGSRLARRIIFPAAQLATGMGARITLLQVLHPARVAVGYPSLPFGGVLEPLVSPRETLARMEELAQVLRSSGVNVHTRVAQTTLGTADAVMNEALDIRADLIALATRGHGVARRFAFGSVAHELVKRSQLPMLVLAPVDEDEEDIPAYDISRDFEVNHA